MRKPSKDDLISFGASLGISYVQEVTSDPKSFQEAVKDQIIANLENEDPVEMKIAFDERRKVFENFDNDLLRSAMEYVDSDDDRILAIKENIAKYMNIFDEEWALNVLKENLPSYYSIIMTDSDPNGFRKWFGQQVQDLISLIRKQF